MPDPFPKISFEEVSRDTKDSSGKEEKMVEEREGQKKIVMTMMLNTTKTRTRTRVAKASLLTIGLSS